jgi:hypothetical protein
MYHQPPTAAPAAGEQPAPSQIQPEIAGNHPGTASFTQSDSRRHRERSSQADVSTEKIRETRFSQASQELARDKSLLQESSNRSCDLKAVLEDEVAKEREPKEEALFCEQQNR